MSPSALERPLQMIDDGKPAVYLDEMPEPEPSPLPFRPQYFLEGPYDSDSSSSDEAVEPIPEMADRAEKMRRRLIQRTSGTVAASSSLPSPAPRPTPPPPRNVVDLTPSPVVSPTRQPPPPQTESPGSKRPAGQTDEPAPKRIRLCHEVEEDAQIWMGTSSVRKWCANVLLPKDVEATHALGDAYILEASLRQSYRNLTFQMEMSKRLQNYRTDMRSLALKLRQTEEAFLEEQAKHLKAVEVHNSEMLRVTRQWEEERDKVATIAATSVEEYKKSAAFEAEVKAAIEARQKEIAKEWLSTPDGDEFLLDLGERDYRLGFREAQTEIHSALLVHDSSFTP
ncbi:PREDICTED: phosphatase and actin regulator 4A-like [Ipomoea nil]|uniref:phosphatase and actin regulator 4A-like n=1 Tax=Ipomoea nil TaxID=35883 RepID=UPI00090126F6|nr:PREDICTED: phosphatase and actin regulator 4A-like [Ipomoea nil]